MKLSWKGNLAGIGWSSLIVGAIWALLVMWNGL